MLAIYLRSMRLIQAQYGVQIAVHMEAAGLSISAAYLIVQFAHVRLEAVWNLNDTLVYHCLAMSFERRVVT